MCAMTRKGQLGLYCPNWVSCLKLNFDFRRGPLAESGEEARYGCDDDICYPKSSCRFKNDLPCRMKDVGSSKRESSAKHVQLHVTQDF